MLKSIKKQAESMWKSLTNVVETNTDKKQLTLNRPIKGTPFTLTGNDETGYFLVLGKYRLTEPERTPEEAVEKLDTETWEIVSRLCAAYIDFEKRLQTDSITELQTTN